MKNKVFDLCGIPWYKEKHLSLCGAGVAHSLGKGEATGSNPVKGIFENLIRVGARVAKGSRL